MEDNERNLKLVRDVLEFAGYKTLAAADGEQGLSLARQHHPDLVLMDLQLPGIDGLEALARLREDPRIATTPTVALSAFAMKDDRERCLRAGFDGYLEKPIRVREFPTQVRAFIEASHNRLDR